MKISRRTAIAVVVLFMVAGALLLFPNRHRPLKTEDVAGIQWLRQIEGGDDVDGFYLKPDGRLLLINIFSMTGDRWTLKKDKLTLWTHTERYPEPEPVSYRAEIRDNSLLLSTDGGAPLSYASSGSASSPGGNHWTPFYLKNPEGINTPSLEKIYLQFDEEAGTVSGSGGVNRFTGSFQITDGTGIEMGPLASTRMAGPGMDYEDLYLSRLDEANTFIATGNRLFLYSETEIVAAFESKKN